MFATTKEKLKFGEGHKIHKREDNIMITVPLSILYDIDSAMEDFYLEEFDEQDDIKTIIADFKMKKEKLEHVQTLVAKLTDEAYAFDARNKLSAEFDRKPDVKQYVSSAKNVIDVIFGDPFVTKGRAGLVPPCL